MAGLLRTVLLEEMTWREVEEAQENGISTVLVPCGATEQHGPHLPIGTDTFLGTAIGERAARMLGTAVVAPTLRPGLSEHHMGFTGSMTLRIETFVTLLRDYCESIAAHGFKAIGVFPSHGGNLTPIRAHLPTIARDLAESCAVVFSTGGLEGANNRVSSLLEESGVTPARAGYHAGWTETSMMLAYRPELVHMEHAEDGRSDDAFYAPENAVRQQMDALLHGIRQQSPNGILGDARGATDTAGDQLLTLAAETVANDMRAALG